MKRCAKREVAAYDLLNVRDNAGEPSEIVEATARSRGLQSGTVAGSTSH
jgi:hypothetical protein